MDEHLWYGAEQMLRAFVANKGFHQVWKVRISWFTPGFQNYIDQMIARGSETDLIQTYQMDLEP